MKKLYHKAFFISGSDIWTQRTHTSNYEVSMNYGSPTPITAAGQLQRFVVRLTLIANIAEDFPCFVFAKEIGHVGGSRHSGCWISQQSQMLTGNIYVASFKVTFNFQCHLICLIWTKGNQNQMQKGADGTWILSFLLNSSFHSGIFWIKRWIKEAPKKWTNTGGRAEVRSAIEFYIQRCVDIGRHFNTDHDNDHDNENNNVTLICWIFRISKM